MRDLDTTETNNDIKENGMTTINPSRVLIDQYLAMIGYNGIEPGSDDLTTKVQADFDAWNEEHDLRPDDELEATATAVGLTLDEYARVLDCLVSNGDADRAVYADTRIAFWTSAAAIAYEAREVA